MTRFFDRLLGNIKHVVRIRPPARDGAILIEGAAMIFAAGNLNVGAIFWMSQLSVPIPAPTFELCLAINSTCVFGSRANAHKCALNRSVSGLRVVVSSPASWMPIEIQGARMPVPNCDGEESSRRNVL